MWTLPTAFKENFNAKRVMLKLVFLFERHMRAWTRQAFPKENFFPFSKSLFLQKSLPFPLISKWRKDEMVIETTSRCCCSVTHHVVVNLRSYIYRTKWNGWAKFAYVPTCFDNVISEAATLFHIFLQQFNKEKRAYAITMLHEGETITIMVEQRLM